MKEWFNNLFSVDEKRVSTLVFAFFAVLGFTIAKQLWSNGDFGDNTTTIIVTFILTIGGVNITPSLLGGLFNIGKNNTSLSGQHNYYEEQPYNQNITTATKDERTEIY